MSRSTRLLTRIALFSALIYVLSWGSSYLPNVNLAFFIAFSSGLLWGALPGMATGAVGMWLWTSFNPMGPAALPIAAAQVFGMALCGLVGSLARYSGDQDVANKKPWGMLLLTATGCTLVFYLPVNLIDAMVFQPFWPRILTGLPFVGISLASNLIIFPLFYGVTRQLRKRESLIGW
jgi:hypothetical protein